MSAQPLHKFAQFASEHNLSQNQARAIGTFLGQNDIKIEAGLQKELVRRNHIVDNYFEVKKLYFLVKGQLVLKQTVMVKDASEFVMFVFHVRKQNPNDFFVKIYFDNGQEYLKLTCSLVPKENWLVGQQKGRNWNGVNTILKLIIAETV